MLPAACEQELREYWLPNLTDAGLARLTELLERASPLLIHGAFTRSVPMGCLATHAAWHHPRTAHLTHAAGMEWLHNVVGLNPATSHVIRLWDDLGGPNWQLRADLLAVLKAEQRERTKAVPVMEEELCPA